MDLACAERHAVAVPECQSNASRAVRARGLLIGTSKLKLDSERKSVIRSLSRMASQTAGRGSCEFAKERAERVHQIFGREREIMLAAIVAFGFLVVCSGGAEIVYCFFDVLFHIFCF